MTAGKTIALTILTFVGKVISLLFNMQVCLSFSSKEQASFNFLAADTSCSDLGAQENKICHCFHFPPSICHEVIVYNILMIKINKQHFNTKIFWLLFRKNGLGFLKMVNFSGIFEILQCAVATEDEAQDFESSTLRF